MTKILFKLIIPSFLLASNTFSQGADTLVFAEGKIINADTKEPVLAKVVYISVPYGNKVGVLSNTSSYSFPMYDNSKFAITVEAEGYASVKYLLDPNMAGDSSRLVKDIELKPGASHEQHMPGHVMLLDNLIFQVGKSKINEESYPELELVVMMMQERPSMIIQLEGHTDYQGDPKQNMKLSKSRVLAVRDYLASRGIKKTRIKAKAFGGTEPLSRDDTPEAHRMNRRVELRILKN